MPSMRSNHKFKTHEEDPVVGNDLSARIFGDNANVCWIKFNLFFSLVDSRVTPLSNKESSKHKTQEFLNHTHDVIMKLRFQVRYF